MSEESFLRLALVECICGCGQPAKTGSQYASDACRARRYDQKNPRVNKAPPELLRALTIRYPPEAMEELTKRERARSSRHPRPPRIHIDVLGEDAELLDRLACEAGISRTAYVSYLIRRAGGRDVE